MSYRRTQVRWLLPIIFAGGFVLRCGGHLVWPNLPYSDEIFQYVEPAYRVITGRGLVPWEFEIGARSWLLPWLLTPFVAAAQTVSSDPAV